MRFIRNISHKSCKYEVEKKKIKEIIQKILALTEKKKRRNSVKSEGGELISGQLFKKKNK